ncbi:MAG: hypothetical protein K2K82_06005 [Muribaculaceae bacterium]|nr:hypothetical protein [Muribaculaceae bacterium]
MELKEVKQQFFALRNGLLADSLRKQASLPHKLIFGLNIIQLRALAAQIGLDSNLAATLWADSDCRESRLLAPMIQPEPQPQWLSKVRTPEEADILCHASLRHHPRALELVRETALSPEPLLQYSALRLLLNILTSNPDAPRTARQLLRTLSPHPLTRPIFTQLTQELDYLESENNA